MKPELKPVPPNINLAEEKTLFHHMVMALQDEITNSMKELDPELEMTEDLWTRSDFDQNPGGGGRTRAFRGKVFENAGVNTSQIYGTIDPKFSQTLGSDKNELWAAGISLIIHPYNPRVPTVHANFRMIHSGSYLWFGGGVDLTPFYPHVEDFQYFHSLWKKTITPFGTYERMKKDCDVYFTNHHRGTEMRGIGGFFYDHFNTLDFEKDKSFVQAVSSQFINSYFPIVKKRMHEAFDHEDLEFQEHRHGRYVEFNLLHDRGTLFGLKTNGRTDSILISLPHRCKFTYQYAPKPGSVHEQMMGYYQPKEWP